MSPSERSDGLFTTTYGETGSRVVFCHGLFGQGKNWTQIGKELSADHRVLLVDMPDHGRSVWTDSFSYVDAADQVAAMLEAEVDDDPVALVGHSMGGKIAMLVALRRPELVERLCVVDVSPVPYQHAEEFRGYINAMQGLDLDALDRRSDANDALSGAVPNDTVRSFLLQNLHRSGDGWGWRMNLDVLDRDLERLGDWPTDEVADLTPYDGPVLWIAGETSPYVQDEYTEPMDALFPRNRRVTIKDAGHWVHSEQSEVFTEVLRRFLD